MSVNPWIVRPKCRPEAHLRLVCFAYAGVGVSAFRGWIDLHPEVEVCLVQLPGRENRLRETPLTSMAELVGHLHPLLRDLGDKPFAFLGHSLGAIVAFETARALRRGNDQSPVHLFASASRAPHLPWPHVRLHHLDEPQFVQGIQERYNGVPSRILEDEELRRILIPPLRADMTVLETYGYRTEEPFAFPITTFAATDDAVVSTHAIEAWREQTTGRFRSHLLSGGHFFLQTARERMMNLITSDLPLTRMQNAVAG